MDLDDERYNLVCGQLKHCLLPEFDREIGNQPLDKADFHTFRYGLNMNLQLLLDIITKHEQLILHSFDENETFRINFILMLHQQSGNDDAPFQTDSQPILNQLRLLINKHYTKMFTKSQIQTECLNYYKERLTSAKWKKNIGAVYGYIQMYKLHALFIKTKLGADETMFMLSVAMLLIDYFEPLYKQFGLFFFNTIIDFGDTDFLSKMNIFEVIYKRIMNPLIVVIKEDQATVLMLSCLEKCIRKFDKWQNPSDWNEIDDVLDEVFKRLAFESNNRSISILLTFISKLTTIPMQKSTILKSNIDYENLEKIIEILNKPIEDRSAMIKKIRSECDEYHNLLVGRWTKKLTEIMLQLPIGKPKEIQLHLHVMHVCYLCCFYGNPLLHGTNWMEFLNKSIISILQLTKSHQDNQMFAQEVKEILETFVAHLNKRNSSDEEKKLEIETFRKSLDDLKALNIT